MNNIPFFKRSEESDIILRNSIKNIIDKIIDDGDYIGGKEIEKFEENWANYCGANYCTFLNSGTDALILAIKYYDLFSNSRLKTRTYSTPASFVATTEAIYHNNRTPCFLDVNFETGQMDVDVLENKICNFDLILPVGLYGSLPNLIKLIELNKETGKIILDSCQNHGSKIIENGQEIDLIKYSEICCYSFYPSKNLGGIFDGGALVTNNLRIDAYIKSMRNHGQISKDVFGEIGYNMRGGTMNAAALNVKLKYLDEWNQKRTNIANRYIKNLSGHSNIRLLKIEDYVKPNWHLFPIFVSDRQFLHDELLKKGIQTSFHYKTAIHELEPVINKGYTKLTELNKSKLLFEQELSLPCYPELSEESVDIVSDAILGLVE